MSVSGWRTPLPPAVYPAAALARVVGPARARFARVRARFRFKRAKKVPTSIIYVVASARSYHDTKRIITLRKRSRERWGAFKTMCYTVCSTSARAYTREALVTNLPEKTK